jgi:threonine dehydrogenase-like Zn-dependent dehydrogenase
MGHEFTGIVKEVGSQVESVKVGDKIVSPFTVSWQVFHSRYDHNFPQLTLVTVLNAFIVRMGFHLAVLRAFSLARQLLTERKQNLSECLWRTEL